MPQCDARKVLRGQKALVTGANSGIGKPVAIALCQAGADVMINYRSGDEQAKAVIEEATHCGCETNGRAFIHKADVSREDEVHGMFCPRRRLAGIGRCRLHHRTDPSD